MGFTYDQSLHHSLLLHVLHYLLITYYLLYLCPVICYYFCVECYVLGCCTEDLCPILLFGSTAQFYLQFSSMLHRLNVFMFHVFMFFLTVKSHLI